MLSGPLEPLSSLKLWPNKMVFWMQVVTVVVVVVAASDVRALVLSQVVAQHDGLLDAVVVDDFVADL